MKKLFKVPVGDWSKDGHSECDTYYVETNYSAQEMRQAYKDTCKKIGLQMNSNKDYTGIEGLNPWSNWRYLLTKYEQSAISEEAVEILLENGFDFARVDGERDELDKFVVQEAHFDSEAVFDLFMWFISYSMPRDFEYIQVKHEVESINGFWNSDLNHQIGYGVF